MSFWTDLRDTVEGAAVGFVTGGPAGAVVGGIVGATGGSLVESGVGGAIGGAIGSAITGPVGAVAGASGSAEAAGELSAGGAGAAATAAAGGALLGNVQQALTPALGAVTGYGNGLLANVVSILQSFASDVKGIISPISDAITSVSGEVNSIIAPISDTVHSVNTVVQQFNDQLIQPIAKVVTTTQQNINSLITAFHTDLSSGLQGLVKLPTDIANAMASEDAVLQRSQQELATQQARIATDILQPALVKSIGGPLESQAAVFTAPPFNEDAQAAYRASVQLRVPNNMQEIDGSIEYVERLVEGLGGFWAPLIKSWWGGLKGVEMLLAQLKAVAELAAQDGYSTIQPTLLSPGEILEAWRRDIINEADALIELARHGVGESRAKVLFDIAQFLFSPRDTVELYARGVIDQSTRDFLMNQNNLDAGQVDALTQLMQHILGPGDLAAAWARGYLSPDLFDALRSSAQVSKEVMGIVQQLEQDLIDPKLITAMAGRSEAAANNFLASSLQSAPPIPVTEQFTRAQAESGTANLAWLAHWRIPGPEWWVDAYFRGLRTRTECEHAFRVHNVPEEIWSDIFAVEEELPPVWLVPDVIASGVWAEADALAAFKKLGFSDANAKVLFDYGASKSKTSKAETAADLQKVSLSNAATMYTDGIIDQAGYQEILIEHGYSEDAASLTIELADFRAAMDQRNTIAQQLVDAAKIGSITDQDAASQLYALGYTDAEVNKWLLKLSSFRASTAKLPSSGELGKFLKQGLITSDTYLATMQAIGYPEPWANVFLASLVGE